MSARGNGREHLVEASPDPVCAGTLVELAIRDRDGKDGQQQREAHRGEHLASVGEASSVRMRITQTAREVLPSVLNVSPGDDEVD